MSNVDLKALRSRPKVKVEFCVDFPNMADQTAITDMTSIVNKFRAGQPLGISGRSSYVYDQVLKAGDDISKPLDTVDHSNRSIDPTDAFIAMKRLDNRINDAKATAAVSKSKSADLPQRDGAVVSPPAEGKGVKEDA